MVKSAGFIDRNLFEHMFRLAAADVVWPAGASDRTVVSISNHTMITPAKRSTRKPTTTSATSETSTPVTARSAKSSFQWPEDPQALLLRYLDAETSADEDAPKRRKPFVSQNRSAVLRVHSRHRRRKSR
jgi:hypothetical protein